MKVAFVHDWLVTYRGGEKVLEAMLELFPEAPIYTLFYEPKQMPESIRGRTVHFPKFLNKFRKIRKIFLPFYPSIIESMPLEEYDLIISTSSCVAKGAIPGPNAKHLCYIHSPMRYIWDQRAYYLNSLQKIPVLSSIFNSLCLRLRMWDTLSSQRVDKFIANSSFVHSRVSKYYGRGSDVIHPPVDVDTFSKPSEPTLKEPYFLVAGAFVSYKRFDLAIKACEIAGVKLVVAGSGPDEIRLRKLSSKNTVMMIKPNPETWQSLMCHAQALIFPGIEDFGITAIEALSSGTPVIAFQGGGALDFVQPGVTGAFFDKLCPQVLATTIQTFDPNSYSKLKLQEFAANFKKETFQEKINVQIKNLTETLK